MTPVALSTTTGEDGEYADALREAGAAPRFLRFDVDSLDEQLAGVGGVVLSGGGDVDPALYGAVSGLAHEIDPQRDVFEIALARRARERGLPTLCICRGLQVANVAFGGTLLPDIGSVRGAAAGDQHRLEIDGTAVRGLIAGHDVALDPDSLLASIVARSPLVTGSRHHQSVATVAAGLRVVATTRDAIVEAAEARFVSPFWLGVQWHPESTRHLDDGASRAIFAEFAAAAGAWITR